MQVKLTVAVFRSDQPGEEHDTGYEYSSTNHNWIASRIGWGALCVGESLD
jgi:hypothetical protein